MVYYLSITILRPDKAPVIALFGSGGCALNGMIGRNGQIPVEDAQGYKLDLLKIVCPRHIN